MEQENLKKRKLTPEDLEKMKKKLLGRKKQLWNEILEVLERDVHEGHKELIQTIRDEGDGHEEKLFCHSWSLDRCVT